MLIADRNGFAVGKSILPPGARWVEYLESTGTQWINTGVFASPSAYELMYRVAWRSESLVSGISCSMGANEGGGMGVNNGYWMWTSISPEPLKFYNLRFSNINGTRRGYIDDILVASPANYRSLNYLVCIFALGVGQTSQSGAGYPCWARVSSCTVINDSTIVRSFAPIAIGTTGYMLDLVSGEYLPYGNQGTGNFVIGPDKVTGGGN